MVSYSIACPAQLFTGKCVPTNQFRISLFFKGFVLATTSAFFTPPTALTWKYMATAVSRNPIGIAFPVEGLTSPLVLGVSQNCIRVVPAGGTNSSAGNDSAL